MRLVLLDQLTEKRFHFHPVALSRPIWELRCGITSLAEKLIARVKPADVACFCPPYMADAYRARTAWPVNEPASLVGDDLLILSPRVKADGLPEDVCGPNRVQLDEDGDCLLLRVAKEDVAQLKTDSIDALIESAKAVCEPCGCKLPTWDYLWDLVLENPEQLTKDFAAADRSGIEGT
ncbi:MAG: hypothetical protein JW888_14410, partial [Pirellulales bacterium]|nr:hypothetical protein [Pirellulales bacterium]